MTKFKFIISGYNDNNDACKLFEYNDGKVSLKESLVLNNPSYVTSYNDIMFSYTKNPLEMVAYQIIEDHFVLLDKISLGLQSMTHLTYSKKNNCIYGASYLDGCMCRIDFNDNKFSNLKIINHKDLYGEDSKCHAIIMNEEETMVLCVNIATSTLYVYDVELNLLQTIVLNKGCGPRHAIWCGDYIYTVTEYSNELIVCNLEKGAIQYVSTLNSDVKSYGATLFRKGDYIYASNRGEETIAVFKVLDGGTVEYQGCFGVNGTHPRHMIEYDNVIISCNKNSNNVSIIDIDTKREITSIDYPNPSGVTIIK